MNIVLTTLSAQSNCESHLQFSNLCTTLWNGKLPQLNSLEYSSNHDDDSSVNGVVNDKYEFKSAFGSARTNSSYW